MRMLLPVAVMLVVVVKAMAVSVDVVLVVDAPVLLFRASFESVLRAFAYDSELHPRVFLVDDGSPEETRSYESHLCNVAFKSAVYCTETQNERGLVPGFRTGLDFARKTNGGLSERIFLTNSRVVLVSGSISALHTALISGTDLAIPLSVSGIITHNSSVAPLCVSWRDCYLPLSLGIDDFGQALASIRLSTSLPTQGLSLGVFHILFPGSVNASGVCMMVRSNVVDNILGSILPHNVLLPPLDIAARLVPSAVVQVQTRYGQKENSAGGHRHVFTMGITSAPLSDDITHLQTFRTAVSTYLSNQCNQFPETSLSSISVVFIMNALSVSGGDISILQEVLSMRSRGVRAVLAVPISSKPHLLSEFVRGLAPLSPTSIFEDMVTTYSGHCCFPNEPSDELVRLASGFDVVVGTYYTTMVTIEKVAALYPAVLPAYYVQDYEPWFLCSPFLCLTDGSTRSWVERMGLDYFSRREQTRKRSEAYCRSTYEAAGRKVHMFAKTDWLVDIVRKNHRMASMVHKISPSVDHNMYYPSPFPKPSEAVGVVTVVAMVRPRTPRRNAKALLDVMLRLTLEMNGMVRVVLFGSHPMEIFGLIPELVSAYGPASHRKTSVLRRPAVELLGVIKERAELANLYRRSDIFVDASWWQAFGRSGVEAMASGCVAVMPLVGAAEEVCLRGKVCVYEDSSDLTGLFTAVESLVNNRTRRQELMHAGATRAREFTKERTSAMMLSSFHEGIVKRRNGAIV